MTIKYLLKADYKKLNKFARTKYKDFEAFVSFDHNLRNLLHKNINIINIHVPGSIIINKKNHSFDLVSSNRQIKKISRNYLINLIDFCLKNNIPNIVVHAGFYDRRNVSKKKKLLELKKFLYLFRNCKVHICLENVPRWFTLYGSKEPLISNIDDLKEINKWGRNIFPILDVDHIAIDTAFKEYQNSFRLSLSKYPIKDHIYEKKYLDFVYSNKKDITKKINKNILDIIKTVRPKYYHAVGSDFTKYIVDPILPLVGEALPLGYRGKIGNHYVTDMIDHKKWIKLIKSDSVVTFEQFYRKDYNYLDQIKKTSKLLNINF